MADSVALSNDLPQTEVLPAEASATTPPTDRLSYVDGMRACAALWVLAFHTWGFGFPHPNPRLAWYEWGFAAGHLGVPVFLVLSGYCLAAPYARLPRPSVDLRKFAIRRMVRIAPPYWICTLVCAFILVLLGHNASGGSDGVDLAWHLALVQNLSGPHFFTINGSLWSVALECQLYVLFPALLVLSRRPERVLWIGGAISLGTWAILMWLGVPSDSAIGRVWWFSVPASLFVFCLGIWAARTDDRWSPKRLSWLAIVFLGAASMIDPWCVKFPQLSLLVAAAGTVCVLIAGQAGFLSKLFGWRPLAGLGLASYTLYLIHEPFVSLGGKILLPRLHGPELFASMVLFACVPIVLAPRLFPILEQPFHRLARSLASAVPARD
jgi:peptidoglycan/LPS O-acetylase OafA/YrhL